MIIHTYNLTRWQWRPWIVWMVEAGSYRWSWIQFGKWQIAFVLTKRCHHNWSPYSYTDTDRKFFCGRCGQARIVKNTDIHNPLSSL